MLRFARLTMGVALVLVLAACGTQQNVLCKDYCDRKAECCDAQPDLAGCGDFNKRSCRRGCPESLQQALEPDGGEGTCANEHERQQEFQRACLYELTCDEFEQCIKNDIPMCEG